MNNKAYNYALMFLAKREYSVSELTNKLEQKGFDSDTIAPLVIKLKEQNLQSDERYAEMICRTRISQGYGPHRIRQELSFHNIEEHLIEGILALEHDNWVDHAVSLWQKKYKKSGNYTSQEIQKQKAYLYSRGFTADTIGKVFKEELTLGN